jgi:hypothetical protein
MAGATLCISCASLPLKNRASAVKLSKCPECQSALGMTSYGVAFRVEAAVYRSRLLSPWFLFGLCVGAGIFIFVSTLIGLGTWSKDQIDVFTATPAPANPPANELVRAPEVAVSNKFDPNISPVHAKNQLSNFIEEIRNVNNKGKNKDAFVLANMNRRPELVGLPFVMGDACRLDMARAVSFQTAVVAARDGMESDFQSRRAHDKEHTAFWNTYFAEAGNQALNTEHGVAALSQILGPEKKTLRTEFVRNLARSNQPGATRAIARAAIFDAESEVRVAAVKVLKDTNKGREPEVTEVLMHGIRYPMAIVAKRSAQAIIALDRKDMLPQLAEVLDEPSPGDPVETVVNDQKVHAVREVVKINHHRNCLLCHPPSQTGKEQEVPGVIPIPGSSFPTSPKEAYGRAHSFNEPMVRADTTYLRQDFSVMMPVENAHPWPEMQRFDFLVRTRPVEGKELAALQQKVQARGADYQSENQKAAIIALTELSGQRDVAPTAVAWKRVVGNQGY